MVEKHLYRSLKFWTLFIGIGAVWGMLMMLIDPTGKMWGMEPILILLQVMPWPEIFFTNFIFSGIVLFAVVALPHLITAIWLFRKNNKAIGGALISGIMLILWIVLEWIIFDFNLLSNLYGIFGFVEAFTAGILLYQRRAKCHKD